MDDFEKIQKLIRLKRYEQPPPGYFEDFVAEFRRRQRAELIHRPLWQVIMDRISGGFPTLRVPAYAYGGIVAVALGASVMVLQDKPETEAYAADASTPPGQTSSSVALSPSSPPPVQIPFEAIRAAGNLKRANASQQYVLEAQPVSYDPSFRF